MESGRIRHTVWPRIEHEIEYSFTQASGQQAPDSIEIRVLNGQTLQCGYYCLTGLAGDRLHIHFDGRTWSVLNERCGCQY